MEMSERNVKEKTTDRAVKQLIASVKEAAEKGKWVRQEDLTEDQEYKRILASMARPNDIPEWFSVAVTATGKIISRYPMEGYECALMLLEAASNAYELHQQIAAETLVLDMLNGNNTATGAFGYAIAR